MEIIDGFRFGMGFLGSIVVTLTVLLIALVIVVGIFGAE